MAITQNTYTGNGSTVLYSFTFPYLDSTDVKVTLNGVLQTITTQYTFANATTIQFVTAPGSGVAIRIYRETAVNTAVATFYPGSSIKAGDLNDNFTQELYLAQEANNEADGATATANTALTNSSTAISTANSAVTTANTASTNASAAVSTANTASTNASNAVTTANTASTNAAAAVSTANTASTNASTAVSTANSAVSTANAATSTANTASTNATAAVNTANTASSNASAAVSTANTASTNATTAVTTANSAVTTANSAVTTANTATTTANTALTTANTAIAAVSSSINYTLIANVAAIPGSPANNTYIEIADSTGIQSFTPLTGLPGGYVGDAGLTIRLVYTTTGTTWNFLNYFPNNAETRYLKLTGGTMTGAVVFDASQQKASTSLYGLTQLTDSVTSTSITTAATPAAVKVAKDTADTGVTNAATAQSTANTANTTANAALPKAGGTMTGNITFNGGQTFPAGTTSLAGVVQLSDSTSTTSSVLAATPTAVKSAYDLANAALPKAGGTMTGDVTLNAQSDLRFADADSSNWVAFQAPATVAANVTWTLPNADATVSGHALKSNAAGTLSWGTAGGATGGSTDDVFYENSQTVTTNYTLTTNKNAMTAGPITINSGITVTVPSGSSWVIV